MALEIVFDNSTPKSSDLYYGMNYLFGIYLMGGECTLSFTCFVIKISLEIFLFKYEIMISIFTLFKIPFRFKRLNPSPFNKRLNLNLF